MEAGATESKGTAMRLTQNMIAILAFCAAAVLAVLAAWIAAVVVENRSAEAVKSALMSESITWATVETDGLQVQLIGTAPNEAARFRAVNLAGSVVDSARVRDQLDVTPVRAIEAPRFSIEMLRNDEGISLIGLLPAPTEDRDAKTELAEEAAALAADLQVSNMLETAAFPAPEGWDAALNFGLEALKLLPRSKISVAADRVTITAISDSAAAKRNLESELAKRTPKGLTVSIDISAPRPVLTPFTLRFVKDAEGARFDACSADTDRARARILAAATAAGAEKAPCTVGLGVPSPSWAEAVEAGINAVNQLGSGSITFSDADVTLLADVNTPQATFDTVVGELQTALPPVFSLQSILPPKPTADAQAGPAEFTASLAEDGQVQLRGRLTDDMLRAAVDSYAKAEFGADKVYLATRMDADLPDGWAVRVLAGLESLGQLHHGSLIVRAESVEVSGVTGSQNARAKISQILSAKLGQGKTFKVNISYDEKLDPLAALPTPDECMAEISAELAKQKIAFTPGSAEIASAANPTMDALAETLRRCPDLKLEIGGHTDAQGSTEGNRALSQARAEAVLLALQGRRVPVQGLTAVGYGEDQPLADNGSEAGREANRRIEFKRLGADAPAPDAPAADTATAETDPASPATTLPLTELAASQTPPTGDASSQACAQRLNDILAKQQLAFKLGSAEMESSSSGTLDALSIILSQCPDAHLEIGGHTDARGSTEGNQKLSEARAKAVLAEMTARKAPVANLTAFGYGEGRPLADNGTRAGREANRRIEFTAKAAEATPADTAAPTPAAQATTPDAAPTAAGPDFSSDTSPSLAPTAPTAPPKPRPDRP